MWPVGSRLEFWVVLGAEIERVVGHLRDLHEAPIRRQTRESHAVALQQVAIGVVELEAMTMALEHDRLSVRASGDRPWFEDARVTPQAHRPAFVSDVPLFRQEVDHRMRSEGVEFGRVRVVRPEGGARELDDHALHSHAQTERRDATLAAEARRLHLALDPAVPEAAWNDDPVEADERLDVVGA